MYILSPNTRKFFRPLGAFGVAFLLLTLNTGASSRQTGELQKAAPDLMSTMGRLAYKSVHGVTTNKNYGGDDDSGFMEGPAGGQAETTIAVDATGQHVVVGFNDTRGFLLPTYSLSGFMYSDNGGLTFVDGGQLPTPGNQVVGSTTYPQIFGDPDIKYLGGSTFVYFSIEVVKSGVGTAQTMCFHRSTDYGHHWTGPFVIPSATNPGGQLDQFGNAADAADKEFADVDPDTGRVLMSWTNFQPSAIQILTTFCDNIKTSAPTWSVHKQVNLGVGSRESGSVPRFAGNGSKNVYVGWSQEFPNSGGTLKQNVAVATSADNGVTWKKPVQLRSIDYFNPDQILGDDRIHSFPMMAVDNSAGVHKGTLYVVYDDNNSRDGGDVAVQRSTDGGVTFTAPVYVDSRPGLDRAQWFPMVAVDKANGNVAVAWNDQGTESTGDSMEVLYSRSSNGGVNWSRPQPLTSRPFHGGYGNDTGQPNLGDYNGIFVQSGHVYASFPTTPPTVLYTDGAPSFGMTVPDVTVVNRSTDGLAVRLGKVSFTNSANSVNINKGTVQTFKFPLVNYTVNAHDTPVTLTAVHATLSSATPGVSVNAATATATYSNVAPGATALNAIGYAVTISSSFVSGTPIDFKLHVVTTQGAGDLLFRQWTGTPVFSTLLSQNFNALSAGSLPAGWFTFHNGGDNTISWTTAKNHFANTTNALWHQNANDSSTTDNTRNEGISTPLIAVPANSKYVLLDFDIAYDTEFEPLLKVADYDGALCRITDFTDNPSQGRSVLLEACAEEFTTTWSGGSRSHFPKHFPRNGSSKYFQDMSNWGGISHGTEHVRVKIRGMAGRSVELRFYFTQDRNGTGANTDPGKTDYGVMIDNILFRSAAIQP
jgi:hypothetical protein